MRTHSNGTTTLGEIAAGPATFLRIDCLAYWLPGGACYHAAKLSIVHAIVLFGAARRIAAIPFACSQCGCRLVDVKPGCPIDVGGGEIWPAIDNHRRMSAHRWQHMMDDPRSPYRRN